VTVTLTASGTAAAPSAVSQGTSFGEFVVAPGGSCAAGAYSAGAHCTVNVVFQPKAPGLRSGAVELLTSTGSLLGESLLSATATGSLPVLDPGNINTVVGDGDWIYRGDGVAATAAPIFLPTGVVTDALGNIFLSDSNNNRIRRVDAVTGLISTVAGTGTSGYNGDNIPGPGQHPRRSGHRWRREPVLRRHRQPHHPPHRRGHRHHHHRRRHPRRAGLLRR
jgi:hypothetical protein